MNRRKERIKAYELSIFNPKHVEGMVNLFTKEEIQFLRNSYQKSLETEKNEYIDNPSSLYYGISGIYNPLNLSSDEMMANKLDEDMTPNEYFSYGTCELKDEMIEHYEQQGATHQVNERGITVLDIPKDAIPFIIKKEADFSFIQEQRRYVLNLLHLCLEKNEITKQKVLEKLGIM